MRTKSEISNLLCITDRKRQRVCIKLHDELSKFGYDRNSKFMNDACCMILEAYLNAENDVNNYVRIISKSSVAKILDISPKTLSNWIHRPRIYEKLVAVGYEKRKKKFTKIEYTILSNHLDL